MRKTGASILFLLIFLPVLLFAQENDDDPSVEPDWEIIEMELYAPGDQTFIISLGTVFPAVFVNNGKVIEHNFSPPVGGTGALSYNYYLTSKIFAGVEISGMFIPTLGKNTAYLIPIGVRAGYQLILWRFEFPLTVTLGMAWHNYLNYGYYGLYIKGGAAVFYRFNSEWSFGLNAEWSWLPEWTKERRKNVDGNIINVLLSARYHF